jgi:hypothetical protein
VIPVEHYDGEHIPAADREFEVVTISDVLHHCRRPEVVLAECLRVASRLVVVKDHFAFGAISRRILLWMDVAGNEGAGVHVEGTYWDFAQWMSLIDRAGGRAARLTWPLTIHSAPFRWIARSEFQFAASIEHRPA